jgi:gluconolactonase
MKTMMRSAHSVRIIAGDLDHPECVNFGPDGYAYAGGEAGQLFRFNSENDKRIIGNTGGGIGGLCADGHNNVYECSYGKPVVHKITPEGEVTVYSAGTDDFPAMYPNYPVFDGQGNLYFSDSGDFYHPCGRVFVVRPNGKTEFLYGGHLHFPNGLAIDAEEKHLYVIQSSASNILKFPIQQDGGLGEPELFANLPETVPDGLAFAESGNLYVSCYAPDVIYRISPDRVVETVVYDPYADKLNRPTNIAFVPGTTQLYFANLGGFSVNCLDVGEKGLPLRYPKF